LASSELSSPITANREYPKTPEQQDSDLKPHHMKMIEDLKEGINNSIKEIQENTGKQAEALKEEINKSLKEIKENTMKQLRKLSKTVYD
jgi:DNA anti-recombination protein RmuC